MKLKFKLSIMVIAILTVVVAGISILLLNRASNIAIDLNRTVINHLSGEIAEYWKGRQDQRFSMLNTLENIFSRYERFEPRERRDRFDEMLYAVLDANPEYVSIYTVWKPNALDGLDAQMTGRIGSTDTGQYTMTYSRETGEIVGRASVNDLDASMAFINSVNVNNLRDRVEPPSTRNVNGKDTYVLRMMRPIVSDSTNQIVGAVGFLMTIEQVQPIVEQYVKENDEIAEMAIFASDGTVIGHIFSDRIGKNMKDTEGFLGDDLPDAFNAVVGGTDFFSSSYSKALDTNLEAFFSPLAIGNSGAYWSVMIASEEDFILSEVHDLTRLTIILAAIIIVAVAVIIYIVLNLTLQPVVGVTNTLKDIAQGEGDLTVKIAEKGKDEITDLSRYFNQTIEKIKNLIVSIKQEAERLSSIGNDLASNSHETAAAVNEINANIQSIKGKVINQSASVSETNATMEQVVTNINALNGHVEKQSNNISKSSSAVEEMVANINSVTNTLEANETNVNSLREASEVGKVGLQEVAADIQEISRESEGLLEINAVMENIASQTNLLSMNAAIEAAHAGEAGKGFAVVADEIRKLAESSSEQSKTISTVLKKIAGSIKKITDSTNNVLGKFEAIDTGVKTVSQQVENIRHAMEEQGEGSKQLLEGTSALNEETHKVKSGSGEMLNGSKEVLHECQNLEKVTQEITGGMNEMASGADQINVAVNQVNEISIKTNQGIGNLLKEVSKFKVA